MATSDAQRALIVVTKMDQGGAMALPLHVAAEMRARGYAVETWYLYMFASAYEGEPGTRVLFPRPPRGLDYVRLFARLVREMRAYRPDVVHGVLPMGNLLGTLAAMLVGCRKRIASQHNPAPTFHPLMQRLDRLFGRLGVFTGNIAVSRAVWDSYAHYPAAYTRRLHIVQNGLPVRKPTRSKAEARARFGLPQDVWILGNVGRLAHQKNQDFLFAALHELTDMHFVIAGDGEFRDRYAAEIAVQGLAGRVHLLGSIPDAEMPDFYSAIDIFVLPSRFEGLPIALIEAMQAALPIVASDIPPSREVLVAEDGAKAGLLLDIDAVDPWVAALRNLKSRPETLAGLSAAARRRADDFSIGRMVDAYEALFFDRGVPGREHQPIG